jgi:hypothetical protein
MDLQTPRSEPHKLDKWTPEIEKLLADWAEISLCYAYLHRYAERKYKRKYHHIQIPVICLSTITGTANFADSYVPDGFKHGFSACVGSLNLFCGILGTLLSFLRYAEIYEAHRISALAWQSLGRSIQIELALTPERRKFCRDFLKVSRSTFDNLLESSPTLDQDVINVFNKKFQDKYPDVTKPLVVTGLQKVSVFRKDSEVVAEDDDMMSVTDTENPT